VNSLDFVLVTTSCRFQKRTTYVRKRAQKKNRDYQQLYPSKRRWDKFIVRN